jgi:hypothetical protein
MRTNALLIATAVAALVAGSGTAFSQGAPKSDSPAVQSNPASKNAPAEKIAPLPSTKSGAADRAKDAEQKIGPANRTGQAPANDRGQMGQANERNKTKSETTGQAPNERNKMGQDADKDLNKSKSDLNKSKSDKSGTTGQAPNQMQNQPAQRATPKTDKLNNDNAAGANQPNRPAAGQGAAETRGGASGSASVNLSTEQKTKIHSIIVADRSAPRVERVDFQVNIGVVVPRTVKLARLPSTIITIEPSWRGYEYFLVGDQIVVVDPATFRIVAVLDA